MNILYIISLEKILNSGIYISQVEDLLISISEKNKNNNITLLYIAPFFTIGRDGLKIYKIFNLKHYLCLKKRYESHKIKFIVCPFILPMVKRWGMRLSIFTIPIFLIQFVPLLYLIIKWKKINVIHCRSYLSGLLASIVKKRNNNIKVLFDPRGFFPEEGVENQRWKSNSVSYKFWKYMEKFILNNSNLVVGLSSEFCYYLDNVCGHKKTELIYAGVNVDKYKRDIKVGEHLKTSLKINGKKIFIYIGALGAWNQPEVIASLYKEIKNNLNECFLIILTNYNRNKIHNIMRLYGHDRNSYLIMQVHPNEVKKYLMAADFGILPGRKTENDRTLSLTNNTMIGLKASEYLASGLPLIANKNIKAVKNIITKHNIGYLFEYRENGTCVLEKNIEMGNHYNNMSKACNEFAEKFLNLNKNSEKYLDLYKRIWEQVEIWS